MPAEVLAVQFLTVAHPWSALDGCSSAQAINQRDGVINRSVSETAAAGGDPRNLRREPFDEIFSCSMTCRDLKSTFRLDCTLVTKLQSRQKAGGLQSRCEMEKRHRASPACAFTVGT